MFPARKDTYIELNLGQAINLWANIPGFTAGPHRQIRTAFADVFPLLPEEVGVIPLHELAHTIRQCVNNLREHPEEIQDQAIMMSQIFNGGKSYVNFDPKIDVGIFSNWVRFALLAYTSTCCAYIYTSRCS